MSARTKLNAAYATGSLLLAGSVGLLTQSWPAFLVALAVLLGCNLYFNEIRPGRRGRGKR